MLLPYMYKYQPFLLLNLKMFTLPVLNFSMVIYHMLMRITGTNMYTVHKKTLYYKYFFFQKCLKQCSLCNNAAVLLCK